MKKFLLFVITLGTLTTLRTNAQDFITEADTVSGSLLGTPAFYNRITDELSTDSVIIKWRVVACDFPADWYDGTGMLQMCDNLTCYSNAFSESTHSGPSFTSAPYMPGHKGNFDYPPPASLTSPSYGVHYIVVNLNEIAPNTSTSKQIVFEVYNWPASVSNVTKGDDDMVLYPVPAHNDINVIYKPESGVKTIAVYNIIGKIMSIYKVTNNSSANISLENVPNGVYFLRMMDAQGAVVGTHKFTKQ